ncbi:MAG: 3-isopropylmalate dehydratase small subunit [Syntrophomonadaceae bacterium]|jgi:3-isopropylmalate dehydratase small subunit|nr:3-isopropylmalate dehydratase small subunit [Syntrophomonadaceae bacterium]
MKITGRVWKFGHDVDTDAIIPARYMNTIDPAEMARHCMEDADPTFAAKVQKGDIIVAGKNFGCGSSREHAPIALKAAGVSCVVAQSFARIFYRNSFNIGLPIFESPAASAAIQEGDLLEIDAATGIITNLSKNEKYQASPFPEFMQQLIAAGGLMNYVAERMKKNGV